MLSGDRFVVWGDGLCIVAAGRSSLNGMEPPGGVVKEPFELGRCCAAAVLVFALH